MWPISQDRKNCQQPERCPHHYVLGHMALRRACQDDPIAFFNVMGSPRRDEFLKDLWRHVRAHCDPKGAPSFSIADVGITTCRIKTFPAIVVAMPPPADTGEAYFVAMILKLDVTAENLPDRPDVVHLTLEKGTNYDKSERTVLCGWTDFGHANFGDGPPPTQAAFISAIEAMI